MRYSLRLGEGRRRQKAKYCNSRAAASAFPGWRETQARNPDVVAVDMGMMGSNPARGLRMRVPKTARGRRVLTVEEARVLDVKAELVGWLEAARHDGPFMLRGKNGGRPLHPDALVHAFRKIADAEG